MVLQTAEKHARADFPGDTALHTTTNNALVSTHTLRLLSPTRLLAVASLGGQHSERSDLQLALNGRRDAAFARSPRPGGYIRLIPIYYGADFLPVEEDVRFLVISMDDLVFKLEKPLGSEWWHGCQPVPALSQTCQRLEI